MHSDAEFDGESDFAIKRGLNPRSDWVTEGQSQNLVSPGPNRAPGKERVKDEIGQEKGKDKDGHGNKTRTTLDKKGKREWELEQTTLD